MSRSRRAQRPYLYIMCGLPFSGKSTLARALNRERGLAVVAMDEVNHEYGRGRNGAAISPAEWVETYAECYRRLGGLLDTGNPVIFDAPSFTRAQRDELRLLAKEHGAGSLVIYVDETPQDATARWQANRRAGERHDVRDEDFALVLRSFEPPTPDERALVYNSSVPVLDWIFIHFPTV